MNKRHGFTLIELLIVVAIIAILAAIAVPNFLEAQTRAKVARCLEDMRTLATALESYLVDNNKYPPDTRDMGPDDGSPDFTFWIRPEFSLTTPIAYITSFPEDPFWEVGPDKYFQYGSVTNGWIVASCGPDLDSEERGDIMERYAYTEDYGFLLEQLINPEDHPFMPNPLRPAPSGGFVAGIYDPTNGTISQGDVFRVRQ